MGQKGEINLLIRSKNDKDKNITYIGKNYYKLPLQVMLPEYEDEDGAKIIYLLNPTGGILQGDELQVTIQLEENAKACITTPSASKIYKCEDEQSATQYTEIVMDNNSELEYFPDLIIPYANSSFSQLTKINLKQSSTFITCDFICSGRITIGESLMFKNYRSQILLYLNEKCILWDQTNMQPGEKAVNSQLLMGQYTYMASFYIYSNKLKDCLLEKFKIIQEQYSSMKIGYSFIETNMLIIRILGNQSWQMKEAIDDFWTFCRQELLGKQKLQLRR